MAATTVNPFIWSDAVALPDAVSRQPFTEQTALHLKGGTHVALFGPRGTGKSSFLLELAQELPRDHGPDAQPWSVIGVDLRRAISVPAFIGAISDSLSDHPDRALRRKAKGVLGGVEKDFGVNLGVVRAGIRSGSRRELNEEVILHAQLAALPKIADRVVIAFDEFQRLNSCPGEPLSQIRSALMGPANAGHVALIFTGSLREKLELMLKTDSEPIWDQAHEVELPDLDFTSFVEYLQLRFEASGKPIADEAAEQIVELGGGHPKRTQQIAWHTWDRSDADERVDLETVDGAYEALLASQDQVAHIVDAMLSGEDSEITEAKVLFLVGSGERPGSRITARRYGVADETAVKRAVERLRNRGVVAGTGPGLRIVDPLLAEWVRRNDPLGLRSS